MNDGDRLRQIKSQALSNISAITTSPKPSYSIDGQSVSWGEYLRQLQETVKWCDQQLASEQPFEFSSQAVT